MPTTSSLADDYVQLCGFREGARFRKMDLHTHSPAGQCSSFRLHKSLADVLPAKKKTHKCQAQWRSFLRSLDGKANPFADALKHVLGSMPRLSRRRPKTDPRALKRIAQAWLDDIRCVWPDEEPTPPRGGADAVAESIAGAAKDLSCYLRSLLFPEEFVLRCYIEGLEVVALTDHNHPGYIVPRLPELGTWFGALQKINAAYRQDIDKPRRPGERMRRTMLARLKAALPLVKGKGSEERKAHIQERIDFWSDTSHAAQRLWLLPGVELTVSNVHVLAVFPPEWYVPSRLAGILRRIGIPESDWGDAYTAAATASVQDAITLVDEAGGIAIPAHVNSGHKGLLRLFKKGLALKKVLQHPALLALESIHGPLLSGARDSYEAMKRIHTGYFAEGRHTPVCMVRDSDAHECRIERDGTGEDMGLRFTHVKMDIRPRDTEQEIFRSLRLALLSGYSRVIEYPIDPAFSFAAPKVRITPAQRRALLAPAANRMVILGITARGQRSFVRDIRVRFNPCLNCVVGDGGKSTLLRLVAYAFGAFKLDPWKIEEDLLPECVRAVWTEAGETYCVERLGQGHDPGDTARVATRVFRRVGRRWKDTHASAEDLLALRDKVDLWIGDDAGLEMVEEDLIDDLAARLTSGQTKPLLVIQPSDLFNSDALFQRVLATPRFKTRQVIWRTASPNVPTALDAEKLIVTGVRRRRGRKWMEIVCAGDLHEDEIRSEFIDHFEGGWPGFLRRMALYTA